MSDITEPEFEMVTNFGVATNAKAAKSKVVKVRAIERSRKRTAKIGWLISTPWYIPYIPANRSKKLKQSGTIKTVRRKNMELSVSFILATNAKLDRFVNVVLENLYNETGMSTLASFQSTPI